MDALEDLKHALETAPSIWTEREGDYCIVERSVVKAAIAALPATEALQAENASLREALGWYADSKNWGSGSKFPPNHDADRDHGINVQRKARNVYRSE